MHATANGVWVKNKGCLFFPLFISHPLTWPWSNQRGQSYRKRVFHYITVGTERAAPIEYQATIYQVEYCESELHLVPDLCLSYSVCVCECSRPEQLLSLSSVDTNCTVKTQWGITKELHNRLTSMLDSSKFETSKVPMASYFLCS